MILSRQHLASCLVLAVSILALVALPMPALGQEGIERDTEGYAVPDAEIQRILSTDKNYATLDALSPDGDHFLVPLINELSDLDRMSRVTYRLATLEIRPQTDRLWHLDTFGIYGLRVFSLSSRQFHDIQLPDGIFVSDFAWSPDGGTLAFLAHLDEGTQVWTADIASGEAGPLSDARVLATIATRSQLNATTPSRMLQWTPEGSVITLLVPADRGPEPDRNPIPTGPMVRNTRDTAMPTRTTQNLLSNDHDAALFNHYTRSQMAELAPGRAPRPIGDPAIYTSISLSPTGDHVLATRVEEPFSYLTSYNGFPQKTVIIDAQTGSVANTVVDRPLREGGGFGGGGNGLREIAWRPDGRGLTYLERAPRDDDAADGAPRMDRVMLLPAPFDFDDASVVVESEHPLSGHVFSLDGEHLFASTSGDEGRVLVHAALTDDDPDLQPVTEPYDAGEITELPGDLWTMRTPGGLSYALMTEAADGFYLEGAGLKDDFRPQPFVDRVSMDSGDVERVFEGSRDSWDRPLMPLDGDVSAMIVARESKTDFPDSFLWEPREGANSDGNYTANLTNNVDPFPQITAARREDFTFTRRDGLEIHGRISLPVGYRDGDRVPAVFWTYPREYTTAEAYETGVVRARNHNAFTHMSWLRWSDIWLAAGYALVYPDVPIVGNPYNDRFIPHMRDSMYAAIRTVDEMGYVDVDRIGHGGHSYGAFTTANILAHAPFFKAGIAGDGAYNRTLTPGGFQSERRTVWEAPSTYMEIAPFFSADQIDAPMLMYHGADDNNSGTWPMQSERMIQALTGLGKNAVLYMYPFESHTPRAMENKLDMWARFTDWFDTYVKGEGAETDAPDGGR